MKKIYTVSFKNQTGIETIDAIKIGTIPKDNRQICLFLEVDSYGDETGRIRTVDAVLIVSEKEKNS